MKRPEVPSQCQHKTSIPFRKKKTFSSLFRLIESETCSAAASGLSLQLLHSLCRKQEVIEHGSCRRILATKIEILLKPQVYALVAVAITGRGGNKYNGDTLFRFDLQIIACAVLLLPVANYYSHLGDNNVSSSICWRMRAIWLKMHVFLTSGSRCFAGGPKNSLALHSDSSRKPLGLILLYM